jgi:hypothetical protein
MVPVPTADGLYASAQRFAQSALDAHHTGDHQRIALNAGTAMEHLMKACLAARSPALLVDLKLGLTSWPSLVALCGFPEGRPTKLRTVGLREVRQRVKTFVTSRASEADLALLIDLRDGVVHAAQDEEIDERLLVAFVQHADAMLADMDRSRADFWADRLGVVDALLADAIDKVTRGVNVKLAQAKAAFTRKYGEMPDELQDLIRRIAPHTGLSDEAAADCPACGSIGLAEGEYWIDGDVEFGRDGEAYSWSVVKLTASSFSCAHCGLRLTSQAELAAAGMQQVWDMPDLIPSDFEPDWSGDYD